MKYVGREFLCGKKSSREAYFKPSCKNVFRATALVISLALPIISNVVINNVFANSNNSTLSDDSEHEDFDILATLIKVGIVALSNGMQFALSTFLITSIPQSIKEDNVELLMDKRTEFLMHADNNSVSSLQYVTVGLGVRDFASNSIHLLVGLPAYAVTRTSI